jgi:hypothetical protein
MRGADFVFAVPQQPGEAVGCVGVVVNNEHAERSRR